MLLIAVAVSASPTSAKSTPRPTLPPPIVVSFSVIPAERGAAIIRSVYPTAHITLDKSANAIVVVAPDDVDAGIRAIASAIDVKNPTDIQVDAQQLRTITPATAIGRLTSVFPTARFVSAPNNTVVVMARPSDMGQIKAILSAIDSPTPTPSAKPHYPSEAVRVTQRNARDIAKAVAAGAPGVKVAVAGNQLLLSGQQHDVDHAKALIAQLDVPPMNAQYTQLYRLKYVDAGSVARLLTRSFPHLPIQVDTDLNAITVLAADTMQHRIADAIAQLDTPPGGSAGPGGAPGGGGGGGGVEVITLNAAIPGLNGAPSSTATDLATTVTQALQQEAPDLHITVPPNSTRLILTGSPYSIK
ncbi:MAG TPA: secretin N-terminal domain-containing protein, partial [Candidatus Aquilonibacter sp.]